MLIGILMVLPAVALILFCVVGTLLEMEAEQWGEIAIGLVSVLVIVGFILLTVGGVRRISDAWNASIAPISTAIEVEKR